MKKVAFVSLSLLFCIPLFAKPLHWNEKASLYDHLVEINKEWLKISDNEYLCEDLFF